MTGLGLSTGATRGAQTLCCALAALGAAACAGPAAPPRSSAEPATAAATTDVASAIVNINGTVAGGGIAGTGMILTSNGVVLTNNHVVAGTVNLTAQVAGAGPLYSATVVGVDATHDVAVIRLSNASHLPVVPIETSGVVNTGDSVTGMGNALGRNGSPVSATGVVTALDETMQVAGDGGRLHETLNGLIQFDAPIQPGDSGGPLLNAAGRVIGMDTAGSTASQAFGAAIPINAAMTIVNEITSGVASPYIEGGHRGILGVDVSTTGTDRAVVTAVSPVDAAFTAGMVAGDLLTGIGGTPVSSVAEFEQTMQGRRPGDHLGVAWRDVAGVGHTATVVLSAGPPA